MELLKLPQVARRLGISADTARRLAKTHWTVYRVGPGSVLVDLDEILADAKEKNEVTNFPRKTSRQTLTAKAKNPNISR